MYSKRVPGLLPIGVCALLVGNTVLPSFAYARLLDPPLSPWLSDGPPDGLGMKMEGRKISASDLNRKNFKVGNLVTIEEKPIASRRLTLLNDFGALNRAVSERDRTSWENELKRSDLPAARRGRLLIQLGEHDLSKQQPDLALARFAEALKSVSAGSPEQGLAKYDQAYAYYLSGRYEDAQRAFGSLLRTGLSGFDRKTAQLRASRASARVASRSRLRNLGVPQPTRIEPMGGAKALSASLQQIGADREAAEALRTVKRTGEDSVPGDLVQAAESLGLEATSVYGGRKGLEALPKPLVAQMNGERYLTVTRTDAKGVVFKVSDLGKTEPKQVRVDWKAWESMRPTAYVAMARRGTAEALALSSFESAPDAAHRHVLLANIKGATSPVLERAEELLALYDQAVLPARTDTLGASLRLDGLRGESTMPLPLVRYPAHTPSANSGAGPSSGDPVNLATGAEDFYPGPDLEIYNPIGPSVSFSRAYHSMSNPLPTGLGSGWTHNYNFRIVRTGYPMASSGNTTPILVFPNGGQVPLAFVGSEKGTTPTDKVATVPAGVGIRAVWKATGGYEVTFEDGMTWTFSEIMSKNDGAGGPNYLHSLPTEITDRQGRYLMLNWAPLALNSPDPYIGTVGTGAALTAIYNSNWDPLLILRYSNTGGNLDAAFEYTTQTNVNLTTARGVYYNYATYNSTGVTTGPTSTVGLTRVSMLVPVTAISGGGFNLPSGSARYAHTYQNYGTQTAAQKVAYLRTISVPAASSASSGLWNGAVATTTITYNDVTGAVTQVQDANGNKTTITPQTAGNTLFRTLVETTDSTNTVRDKYYVYWDANLSEKERVTPLPVDVLYSPSFMTFGDPQNPYMPSSVRNAHNQTWYYTWDKYGNIKSETTPRGTTTTYTYDETVFPFELTAVQEGSKTPTTISYLPNGLIESVVAPRPYDGVSPAGATDATSYTYTALGQLKTTTEPGPNGQLKTTTFEYLTDGAYSQTEKLGQPLKITNPEGKVWRFRYDARGNETDVWDPEGYPSQTTYNMADDPVKEYVTKINGSAIRLASENTYLYVGGPLTIEKSYDEGASVVRTANASYEAEGELATVSGRSQTVTRQYDPLYRVTKITDGKNQTSQSWFNVAGQMTAFGYPVRSNGTRDQIGYFYDASGRVNQRIDAIGRNSTYKYLDPDGELSAISYSSNSVTPEDVAMTYDTYGRPYQVQNGTATEWITYDDRDLVKTRTVRYAIPGTSNFVPDQVVSYTYWPDGSRKTMTTLGKTWTYTYDLAGRCTGMNVTGMGDFAYTYGNTNILLSRLTPSGLRSDYTYHGPGVLAGVTNKQVSTTLSSFSIPTTGYNGVLQVTSMTSSLPSASILGGTTTYGYDTKDQLSSEVSTRNGGVNLTYSYDNAGNLGTSSQFNQNNQRNTSGFVYDAEGSPTSYLGYALTFDRENRLTAFSNISTYAWRADGLRAWKSTGGVRTFFVYDGTLPIGEVDSTGAIQAINVFGPTGLEARIQGSTPKYYTFDLRGNAVQEVSATGTIAWSAAYYAYGTYASTGTISGPFRFGARWGYYLDAEIGTYLCTNRFYDAGAGRWFTRDPAGYAGGINLYAYCENDPINNIDPYGLQGVGQPGFAESFIPVWGSGRAAIDDFQNGRIGWGIFNTVMAVSDVFMVGTVVKSVAKFGVKATLKVGTQPWKAVRARITKRGMSDFNRQEWHHIIKQRRYANNRFAKAILNQPFMVTKLKNGAYRWKGRNFTMNQWHKLLDGYASQGVKMTAAERAWYGSNAFHRAAAVSATGDVIQASR